MAEMTSREKGYYYDYVEFPLKVGSLKPLKSFEFPDPDDPPQVPCVDKPL